MKLQLKKEEIIPYLPFKLNYFVDFEDGDVAVYEMIGIFTDSGEIYLDGYETNLDSKNCKPILRPLSDLTKEIEEGKPLFFPSKKTINCINEGVDLLSELYYNDVDYLIRNHFDVFGLIEKGLAIDINTI